MPASPPTHSLAAYLEATEHWPRAKWPERLAGLARLVDAGIRPGQLPDGTSALACLFPSQPTDDALLLSPMERAQWRAAAASLPLPSTPSVWEGWESFAAWRARSAWARAAVHAGLFGVLIDRLSPAPPGFWTPPEPSRAWPADPVWEAVLAAPFDEQGRVLEPLLATGYSPRPHPGQQGPFQALAALDSLEVLDAGLKHGLDPREPDGEGNTWLDAALDAQALRWVARLVQHDPGLADQAASPAGSRYADALDCLRAAGDEYPPAQDALAALRGYRAATTHAAHLEGSLGPAPPSVRSRL